MIFTPMHDHWFIAGKSSFVFGQAKIKRSYNAIPLTKYQRIMPVLDREKI